MLNINYVNILTCIPAISFHSQCVVALTISDGKRSTRKKRQTVSEQQKQYNKNKFWQTLIKVYR